ncbi:---NA--- [Paramuricea clavata]|nr:---NA--- [Paramuricea clavata]
MENKAIAFVGCDNDHCCGCYGPVGGTKDYCAENCQAINGGTISKHVFTWFWVRSSLPKIVWKKCMDYKLKRNDGKLTWYKFVRGSVVPIEIVVVPDGTAAQKIPPVPGLLEYRKDNKKLYVRSNKSWNVIGEEKKVLLNLLCSPKLMNTPELNSFKDFPRLNKF